MQGSRHEERHRKNGGASKLVADHRGDQPIPSQVRCTYVECRSRIKSIMQHVQGAAGQVKISKTLHES